MKLVTHMADMGVRMLFSAKDGVDARFDFLENGWHCADLVRGAGCK